MKTFVINGKFMSDRMQGVVRHARELCLALDKLLDETINVILLIPKNAYDVPEYKNIRVEVFGEKKGILWEQFDLRNYLKSHPDYTCINFCNTTPLLVQPGITTIHDIMYKVNPSHYTTVRNRLSRFWHMFLYSYICRHEKLILTDSIYSKREIEKYYPKSKGKIKVIYCGWQHVKRYNDNPNWQYDYPYLIKDKFFFSLSTLSKNKNGQWIIEVAKKNPNETFAIAGKYYETEDYSIPENVHMLGFISDEDACSLIKNCKAFIHPSLYEGFGLPPLEALALGTDVISSNVTSLPEVLKNSVHYIDPYDTDVDIEKLLQERIADASEALDSFSWEESANKILDLLRSSDL